MKNPFLKKLPMIKITNIGKSRTDHKIKVTRDKISIDLSKFSQISRDKSRLKLIRQIVDTIILMR